MTKDADLGDRCLKCNGPCEGRKLKRKLSWHPQGWYLLLLFNVLIYIIVAMIVRHTATIYVPLCDRHRRKRRRAIAVAWLVVLLCPVAMIAIAASELPLKSALGEETGSVVFTTLLMASFAALIGAIFYGVIGSQPVTASQIDKRFVRLRKVSPEVLASLPSWSPAT
jgi:Na+/proline symporter